MATVINRTTVQLLYSVNTPDYSEVDWIINPDLSPVAGVPQKYWKIVDDDVIEEMTAEEKAAYDAAHPTITASQLKDFRFTRFTVGGDHTTRWVGTGTSIMVARMFRFVGSGKAGVPSAFRAIVGVSGAYTGSIILRDMTNNNTLASITSFSGELSTVTDDDIINVPTDPADMAVQMQGSDDLAEVYLYFFELVFDT